MLIVAPLISKEVRPPAIKPIEDRSWDGFNEFKRLLAIRESGGNPRSRSVNGYYKGLYHIGRAAATDARISHDSLFNPYYSDLALSRLMHKNKQYIGDYSKHIGRVYSGVKVTEAGILAAAHLTGHYWARKWLASGGAINGRDDNGTTVEDYMKLMENVELINY